MKKPYLLVLFVIFFKFSTFAQTYDTTTFYGKMGFIYNHLSKTPITTGLLREYGIDFESLELFTGQFLNDTNYTNLSDWRLLYQTIVSEQITTAANLLTLDSINTVINTYTSFSLPITFAELYYSYQGFDSTAVSNNWISISNGQLYDVAGRSQSPYKSHYVFSMAPTRQTVFEGSNQMIVRPQLFFSNVSKTISTVRIDPYGTGTYQVVLMNQAFTVNYIDTGIYTINFKITYSDSSTNVAHSKVIVYLAANGGLAMNETKGNKSFGMGPPNPRTFRPYDDYSWYGPFPIQSRKAYMGSLGNADYTVEYSKYNSTGIIRKPLIVVDGFDPMAQDYYSGNTFQSYYYNTITYDGNDTVNFYNPIPLNGITGQGFDDADSLDIVYLHWPHSTDYIERNAYVLENLIQMIDSIKTVNGYTYKNVVVGFSMGGLVARYALRDMEQNGIDHQTRIFISQDVPYWGANIPVGMQLMVQHLAPWKVTNGLFTFGYSAMFPQLAAADTLFSTPAAKEMLIQRYVLHQSGITGITPVTYSISADNTTHTSFLSELSTMGWPANCRNVTFSNGSCNGTPVFTGSNKIMIDVSGTYSQTGGLIYAAQLMASLTLGAEGGVWEKRLDNLTIPVNPISLATQLVLGPVTTRPTISIGFQVYSIPSTGTATIYNGNISIKRQLFFGVFNETSNLINYNQSSTSDMLPLDNAPGGVYPLLQFGFNLDSLNDQLHNKLGNWANAVIPQPNFCFVPTVSALAITNPTTYLDSSICGIVNCMNPSAVYDYYAPSANQIHASYTAGNSNWILKELTWGYGCQKICPTSLAVSGDSLFCTVSHQFSVTALPNTDTMTWTIFPTGSVNIYNPYKDTTTLSIGATSSLTTLSANINAVCGVTSSLVVSKNVKVGAPTSYTGSSILTSTDQTLQSCTDLTQLVGEAWTGYVSTSDLVASTYSWSLVSVGSGTDAELYDEPNAQNVEIQIKPTGGTATWQLTIANTCGSYKPEYSFNGNSSCGVIVMISPADYSVSPNPATNTVTLGVIQPVSGGSVSSPESDSKTGNIPAGAGKITMAMIYIYSASGQLVRSVAVQTGQVQVTIGTNDLATGTYFLQIIDNNNMVKTKKLIIQR